MNIINIDNLEYHLIKNYRDAFDLEDFKKKYTDFFHIYDYVVGDWAYGKLRLKGFYNSKNKNCNKTNCFENLNEYLKNNCAFDCKHFILKKSKVDFS